MTFSREWDERYRSDTHASVWPWTDLVALVMRHAPVRERRCSVLELGCGAGANIPLFRSLDADYHAIDGSDFVVERLRERYPDLKDRIVAGDFCREIPFAGPFDVIVDRAALTHCSESGIDAALSLVRERMTPDGLYFGVDWFGVEHDDFSRGNPVDDDFTRTGYTEGPFAHVGKVHFSDRAHLEHLFREFELLQLDRKILIPEEPAAGRHETWNLVARRKENR